MTNTHAYVIARNEEGQIGNTLRILNGFKEKGLIEGMTVIDDASTDKTAQIAREHGANVFTHPENRGKRGAFVTIAELAEARRGAKGETPRQSQVSRKNHNLLLLDADVLEFPEETLRAMLEEVAPESKKRMAIAQQYEKAIKPKEGEPELHRVKGKGSNAHRLIRMDALNPYYANNKKWHDLLTMTHEHPIAKAAKNRATMPESDRWGLESTLDTLVNPERVTWLEKHPVITMAPYRKRGRTEHAAQEGAREKLTAYGREKFSRFSRKKSKHHKARGEKPWSHSAHIKR